MNILLYVGLVLLLLLDCYMLYVFKLQRKRLAWIKKSAKNSDIQEFDD